MIPQLTHRPPVAGSEDLDRILALPRRAPIEAGSAKAAALISLMTERLRRPDRPSGAMCGCRSLGRKRCIDTLLFTQAWSLYEAPLAGGLLAPIGVGAGKCLTATAEVFDYITASRRSVSEGGSVRVASVSDAAFKTHDASAFPSGTKQCVRLTLKDGSSVEASTDHPILTARGWVDAAMITTDDLVAVASSLPEPEAHTRASDDEVSLIALLMADGGLSQNTVHFTNATDAVIREFKHCASSVCSGWSERSSRSRAREFTVLGGRCRTTHSVRPFRDKWGLYGLAKNKRLHPSLWGLPRKQVGIFVNRFWACDGYLEGGRGFGITLASEKLLDDIRFLLLRLDIRSRKHFAAKTCNGQVFDAWRLAVYGADALRFLEEVGNILGKEDACAALRKQLTGTSRNTNTDIVPIGRPELQEICDELGIQGRGGCYHSRRKQRENGTPSRTDVRAFLSATDGQYVSRKRFAEFCKTHQYAGKYSRLLIDGVAWERVRDVVDIGVQKVYDLSVPGPRNFVANGIVVHNTALNVLMPMVVPNCKVAVLFVPPGLVEQLRAEYLAIREHFRVPSIVFPGVSEGYIVSGAPRLHVVPYSRFSRSDSTELLEKLKPDLALADEVHNLKNRGAVRTGRFMRYFAGTEGVRLCGWSGSITSKSLKDFSHLMAFALGEGSPVPLDPDTVEQWAAAIDPSPWPAPAGDLKRLLGPGEHDIRVALRRRLLETRGVVSTSSAGSCDASIYLREREAPKMPKALKTMIADVRSTWTRPDGEEFIDALEIANCVTQLACGFYYRWRFPGNPEPALVEEWFAARKAWNKELREQLKRPKPHLDSPELLKNAAERYLQGYEGDLPVWQSECWARWRDIKDRVEHETEVIWVDDYLVKDAAAWAKKTRGIVWYLHTAFGEAVAKAAGIPRHGGGPDAEKNILAERGDRSIVVSIKSHGTGRNGLQHYFSEQLVANPPSSGDAWEQLLGRTHRLGQEADEVTTDVYRHVPEFSEPLDKALELAKYIEGITGNRQKLLTANVEWTFAGGTCRRNRATDLS